MLDKSKIRVSVQAPASIYNHVCDVVDEALTAAGYPPSRSTDPQQRPRLALVVRGGDAA